MNERILFVDDEPNVLEGIQRVLKKKYEILTAAGGAEGLDVLRGSGPFALVVSDMRMPSMNGAEFLEKVRQQAPDAVRMILSGQADLAATIAAINEGHVYRFLTKPCTTEQLLAALEDGLIQHRLVTAEKVLLAETLNSSVKMLIELLGMISPAASSRASRLQRYVVGLASSLGFPEQWQWGLAAYVSQIGCVALARETLSKVEAGQALTGEEQVLYESHPEVAGRLLEAIPRLEEVAQIVKAQFSAISFLEQPNDLRQWDVCSVGILLLRTAIEVDHLTAKGASVERVASTLRESKLGFPEAVTQAVVAMRATKRESVVRRVRVKDLAPGMVLEEDLMSPKGLRLVPSGQEITSTLIVRLRSIAEDVGVAEPFRVRVVE